MDHEHYMRLAIEEAKRSKSNGGKPFSSLLVKDGQVVARAHNPALQDSDPTSHAELNVVRSYCTESRVADLEGYTIYASCEPCAMCASAIAWANVSTVVFGAGHADIPGVSAEPPHLSCQEVIRRFGRPIEVIPYVLREECAALLQ